LGERRRDSDLRVAAGATRLYSVVLLAAVTGRLERVIVSVVDDADTRWPVGRRRFGALT
jgi:hypothetical protein